MKRGAEEEQQVGEAAAAKRVKLEQEPSNDAVHVKDEPDSQQNGSEARAEGQQAAAVPKQEQQDVKQESENEDDAPIQLPVSTTRSAVRKGHECPYLDTILRQVGVGWHADRPSMSLLQSQQLSCIRLG